MKMLSSSTLGALLGTILLISSIPDAASYTKYGRTCKDIGCRRDEVCVMAEDPCSIYQRDNCGRYPTCAKAHPGGASCESTVCGENEYCKTENGMPTCVKKSTAIDNELFAEVDTDDNRIVRRRESAGEVDSSAPDVQSTKRSQSGYPSGSGYPSSDSSRSLYPSLESQPKPESPSRSSGYPSNSGYPSSGSSGYPASSGYPSRSSGYPSESGSSSYPGYPSRSSSGYPSGSGYPSESGYPARSSSGYPTGSGYPSRSSGYPSGSSGYPSGSYPSSSGGYPSSSTTNEESVKRVDASSVNAAYPGYPSQGQATRSSYPSQNSGYPSQGQATRSNYPSQNSGYPSQSGYSGQSNPYGNYYPGYSQGYPQGYPQGYQQGYPPGYQQGYYPPGPTTRKPSFGDQLTNIAKDLAGRYLTQAIIDKVSGRSH